MILLLACCAAFFLFCFPLCADSEEAVAKEIPFFFPDFDIQEWMEKEEELYRIFPVEYDTEFGVHKVIRPDTSQAEDSVCDDPKLLPDAAKDREFEEFLAEMKNHSKEEAARSAQEEHIPHDAGDKRTGLWRKILWKKK